MRPVEVLVVIASTLVTAASIPALQKPLAVTQEENVGTSSFRIPTIHESAVMARRMLHKEGIATLSTIFPSSPDGSSSTLEDRPSDVAGMPFALIEYFADCEPDTGNPTILAVDITTTYKNAKAGSNVTMSVQWHPTSWEEGTFSVARLPRYSLVGYFEDISDKSAEEKKIKKCFLKKHPDVIWSPGNDIHTSRWVRFVVREVYWFGGFGDRARIGWLPTEEWRSITADEVSECRLPGDDGESSKWARWSKSDSLPQQNSCPSNY